MSVVPVTNDVKAIQGKATHSSLHHSRQFLGDVIHNDAFIGCRQRGGALASAHVVDDLQVLNNDVLALAGHLLVARGAAAADVAIIAQRRRRRSAVRLDAARGESCEKMTFKFAKKKQSSKQRFKCRVHPDDKIQLGVEEEEDSP